MSDSEFESASIIEAPQKKKKTTAAPTAASKRKRSVVATSPVEPKTSQQRAASPEIFQLPSIRKNKKQDLFRILQSEEAASSRPKFGATAAVISSFASRVSTGTSRRTAYTDGDYFIDLKVYKSVDYINNPVDVRYKKALAAVKLRCEDASPSWEALQAFLGQAWTVFENSEPVHYTDKINFK